LSKNTAVSTNGMKMVGNFTGRAGEREASRSSDAGEKPKFAIMAWCISLCNMSLERTSARIIGS